MMSVVTLLRKSRSWDTTISVFFHLGTATAAAAYKQQ
jgi:hypothetical protein